MEITKSFLIDNYVVYAEQGISPRSDEADNITLGQIEKKRMNLCHMITQLVREFELETNTGVHELNLKKGEGNKLSTKWVIVKTEIW